MTKGFCVALIFVSGLFVSRSARANTIGDPNAVIAAGGTLGIGTSTPHSTVTIIGDIAAQSGYWVGDAYSAYGTIYGAPWYGLGRSTLKVYPQTVYPTVQLAGYYGLNLITAGGILVMNSAGAVGIGTTTPGSTLHVAGNAQITGWGSNGTLLVNGGDSVGISISGDKDYNWSYSSLFSDVNGNMALQPSWSSGAKNLVFVPSSGKVGIGTATPTTLLDVNGEATVNKIRIRGGSDLSEQFAVRASDGAKGIVPGMVVSIDPTHPGQLIVSSKAYDKSVAGIVSGAGGIETGMTMGQAGSLANGEFPIALSGRVYCMVDGTYGAIEPGDLLTTSDTPGYAMRVQSYDRAHGTILGKAMTGLAKGKGLVMVLVNLQ